MYIWLYLTIFNFFDLSTVYPTLKNKRPKNKPTIKNDFIKLIFSFKKNKPNKIANKIEVSLMEDTTAMGRNKHAQTTIP